MTEIADADVAGLVAWRRGHRARGELISNLTQVNDTTKTLRALFTYSKRRGIRFDHEPHWRVHLLPVPAERVCASWSATRPSASRRRRL